METGLRWFETQQCNTGAAAARIETVSMAAFVIVKLGSSP